VVDNGGVIDELIARMEALLETLRAAGDQRRYFHATYQRTTIAVAERLRDGGFDDPEWVERWDVAFADPALLARRESDHRAIDDVLASRVGAEDAELAAISGSASPLDRLLRPASRLGTRRFLRESREKVWANAVVLSAARRRGPQAYASALNELAELSAAKVTALQAPGQVLLKLASTGFGVRLTS
jgi:Family of unknown function (DUF5995)